MTKDLPMQFWWWIYRSRIKPLRGYYACNRCGCTYANTYPPQNVFDCIDPNCCGVMELIADATPLSVRLFETLYDSEWPRWKQ